MKFPLHSINITTAVLRSFVVIFVEIRTVPSNRFDTDTDTGADLEGVTKVTSHPPWRGSLFHVIIMLVM